MTTSDAELLRFCDYILKYYNPYGDAEALTIARALKEKLTPAPEPVPPLDEIAEIEERHEAADEMPYLYNAERWLALHGLAAHDDRDTLLRILRSRTVDKEALAKWLFDNFPHDPNAKPSDPYWPRKAQALIDSGLLGGSIGNAP